MAISYIGSASAAARNGGSPVLTLPSAQSGDYAIVMYGITNSSTRSMTITSSTGATYTTISSGTNGASTGTIVTFVIAQRTLASTGEVTVTCSGTAASSDSDAAVAFVFRDDYAATFTQDATPATATGTSTNPDSPSITLGTSNPVVITCFGISVAESSITQPSSWLDPTSASTVDTKSITVGAAWITATASGAFNPSAWAVPTSGVWVAGTVAIRAGTPPPFTWFNQAIYKDVLDLPVTVASYG